MPYANPDDQIKWRQNNRDYHKTPEQRKKHKVRKIKEAKLILENLPDKYEYHYTKDKKSKTKYNWIKVKGLLLSDFERTWDRYINTTHCELCDISLKKVRKNMDHHHESGYMRFIVCQRCNGFLRYRDQEYNKVLDDVKR
jgi:hypothetical protein